MEIEEALVAHLLAQPGLTALISQKIFPEEVPQGVSYPAVIYKDISDIKIHTLTGQDNRAQPVKQFTVYANTKADAKVIAKQIETALKDFQGTMSGIYVQYLQLQNEISNMYRSGDGTIRTFTHDLEFQIHYTL